MCPRRHRMNFRQPRQGKRAATNHCSPTAHLPMGTVAGHTQACMAMCFCGQQASGGLSFNLILTSLQHSLANFGVCVSRAVAAGAPPIRWPHSEGKEATPPKHTHPLGLSGWSLEVHVMRMAHPHAQGRGQRHILHLQGTATQLSKWCHITIILIMASPGQGFLTVIVYYFMRA